jgi:hypothetical protein
MTMNTNKDPQARAHNLEKVREMMTVPPNEDVTVTQKVHRIMITRLSLQGLQPKIDVLNSTPLCTGWMVFLNKAGTLAHIMHAEDVVDGSYIRMKIPSGVAGAHEEFMRRWFYNRMVHRYVI